MKRRLGRGLALALLVGLLGLAALAGVMASARGAILFDDKETLFCTALLDLKRRVAGAAASPKLVLVGGSSVHIGISARELGDRLGVACLNFGQHAGLGLPYILFEVEKILEPGDVVLLAPEYFNYFDGYPAINDISVLTTFQNGSEYPFSLAPGQVPGYLSRLKYGQILSHVLSAPWREPRRNPMSAEDYVDAWGDYRYPEPKEAVRERMERDVADYRVYYARRLRTTDPLTYFEGQDAGRAITAFLDFCRARGVGVLATYPNCAGEEVARDPLFRELIDGVARFYARHGVPMVGTADEAFFPVGSMYDSFYHLDEAARSVRTARLAEELDGLGMIRAMARDGGPSRPIRP